MSLDWAKDRKREVQRIVTKQAKEAPRKSRDSEAFSQAFSDAVIARRANKFYRMPDGISAKDQKRLWARVYAFMDGGH